jgi:4-amino-4-deoxy-L-arabinose transferase-like glycosyltransferase
VAAKRLSLVWILSIVLISVAFRALLLAAQAFPFNADEAIVALMARHILQGEWPVFFYGQAYLGSLDAWLVAAGFALIGQHVLVIRAVQLLLYAGTIAVTMLLAGRIFVRGLPVIAAGLLLAFPPLNVVLYTTVSLGGYGEALLIGALLLFLALEMADHPNSLWRALAFGLTAGIGLWAFVLTFVFLLPALVLIVYREHRRPFFWRLIAGLAGGAMLGASPMVAWAISHGIWPLLGEAGGAAIAGASSPGWLQAVAQHAANFLLFGISATLGLRPPWQPEPVRSWLLPVVLVFWLAAAGLVLIRLRNRQLGSAERLLAGMTAILVGAFILTPFGADPSGRYFVPLIIPMALFGSGLLQAVERRAGKWSALLLLLVVAGFNVQAAVQSTQAVPPGLTTQFDPVTRVDHDDDQALIKFLLAHGEKRGYATYWIGYPLAFLSAEELIYVPRLPYHPDFRYTARDDRYPPYDSEVAASPKRSFITNRQPWLDIYLAKWLRDRGVDFREADVGDYHVFFGLSMPVPPPDFAGSPEAKGG